MGQEQQWPLRFRPVNKTAQTPVSVKTETTKCRLALYLCDSKENATLKKNCYYLII